MAGAGQGMLLLTRLPRHSEMGTFPLLLTRTVTAGTEESCQRKGAGAVQATVFWRW